MISFQVLHQDQCELFPMQEKAFPCPYDGCDKACIVKPQLRNHLINNHIKTRPSLHRSDILTRKRKPYQKTSS